MADNASAISSSRPGSPTETDTPGPLEFQSNLARTAPYRFHWDAASRRPGPPSVSEGTESRADFLDIASRNDLMLSLTASNASLPHNWSSTQHGFNAISTVLNNPRTKPAALKSSRAPIPTGPSSNLPRIRKKDFDGYLKAVGPEWEKFMTNQRLAKEAADEAADSPNGGLLVTDPDSTPMPSRHSKTSKNQLPPLDSVPSVYFDSDFTLSDPHTFSAVTEEGDGAQQMPVEEPAVNQELQEKLSQHLDVVEQHLTMEISVRSSSFFAALSNLQSLQAEGAECLNRIGRLRKELLEVDEKQAKKGLHITRLLKRMENLQVVQDGVEAIQAVGESIGLVKNLVGAGEYFEALGLIEAVQKMFDSGTSLPDAQQSSIATRGLMPKSNPPITLSLSSITALSSLPIRLRDLSSSISTSLSADLIAILRADLMREPTVGSIPAAGPPNQEIDTALRDRVSPLLQGLMRTDGVEVAVVAYSEVALAEIRVVVRKHLPPSAWDEIDASTSTGAPQDTRNLKAMHHSEFLQLMRSLYATLLQRISTVSTHISCISSVVTSMPSTSVSPGEVPTALSDLLSSVTELANSRASSVISLRSAEHAQLGLPAFLDLFNESWAFVVRCEVIARRMIVGLRGVVVSQAKLFLQAFHQHRISDSAKMVEDEVWGQVEVSPESQRQVDIIVNAAVSNPMELLLKSDPSSGSRVNGSAIQGIPPSGRAKQPNAKLLIIEERSYYVVGATLQVMELVVDYLKVIVNISLLTTDTMSKVIEFLKSFNSRTCQVVLGAGAMRSAGLKNITAKHLALASQSLSIMIALIPYVRETFRRHLNPKQAVILVEFDKLKRDYQEHQNEIHAKLIAIMGDRLSVHCRSLSDIQWDQPPAKAGPNPYMEVLVKETVTLHKVLSKYLSNPVVELIMTQVFAAVNHRLSEEYGKIELPNQEAKTRLLQDARYLNEKLSSLKNVTPPGGMLETVVMEKLIPRKGSPFPIRRSTLAATSGGQASPLTPHDSLERDRLGSSLLPGSPQTRSRSPTPTHSLLGQGRTSPSPLPTPRPTSPLNRPSSPLTNGSSRQNPTSPLAREIISPPLSIPHPDDPPPPTPEKDEQYTPSPSSSNARVGLGLGLGSLSEEPGSIEEESSSSILTRDYEGGSRGLRSPRRSNTSAI